MFQVLDPELQLTGFLSGTDDVGHMPGNRLDYIS